MFVGLDGLVLLVIVWDKIQICDPLWEKVPLRAKCNCEILTEIAKNAMVWQAYFLLLVKAMALRLQFCIGVVSIRLS